MSRGLIKSILRATLVVFFVVSTLSSNAYVVCDARGQKFDFPKPPTCISLVPAVTQNIFAIGAGDLLLADSKFCDYPEEAKSKIKIGGFIDPDYEKIVELKPDVVVLPSTAESRIEHRLKKLGIKCFLLNGEGLKFIADDIRLLGKLTQKIDNAERLAREFEQVISLKNCDKKRRRALFMFGRMAAGKGSFAGDIIEACGLINCAESTGLAWAEISREFVLSARPDIIFVETKDEDDRKSIENFYKTDLIWKSTPAVKKSAICYVPSSLVVVPSVRVLEAIKLMRDYCSKKIIKPDILF